MAQEYSLNVGVVSQLARPALPTRSFLLIQNKGAAIVRFKVGEDFKAAQSGVQLVTFLSVPTAGAWKLTYDGQQTSSLAFNADAAAVQAALEALSSIGSGNVTVDGDYTDGFEVTFAGDLAESEVEALVVSANTLTDNADQESDIQLITWSAVPAAGTFKLKFGEEETTAIPWDVTAEDLALYLCDLPSIGVGGVTVAKDSETGDFTITFAGSLANQAIGLLEVTDITLVNQAALADEEQRLFATPAPAAGGYKLLFDGDTTAEIAYDAEAADIQAALEALGSVGAGNVAVEALGDEGDLVAGYKITFQGDLEEEDLPAILVVESTLQPADALDDDEDRLPDAVLLQVVTAEDGAGETAITAEVTHVQDGQAPAAVTTEVEETTEGRSTDTGGIQILVGGEKLYDGESVPIDAIYIVADADNTPVEILEE